LILLKVKIEPIHIDALLSNKFYQECSINRLNLKPGDIVEIRFCFFELNDKNEFYVNLLADNQAKLKFERVLNIFGNRKDNKSMDINELNSNQIYLSFHEENWHRVRLEDGKSLKKFPFY
jgi:hypothetical protein